MQRKRHMEHEGGNNHVLSLLLFSNLQQYNLTRAPHQHFELFFISFSSVSDTLIVQKPSNF